MFQPGTYQDGVLGTVSQPGSYRDGSLGILSQPGAYNDGTLGFPALMQTEAPHPSAASMAAAAGSAAARSAASQAAAAQAAEARRRAAYQRFLSARGGHLHGLGFLDTVPTWAKVAGGVAVAGAVVYFLKK